MNLWRACRKEFGDGARIDYAKLIDLIQIGRAQFTFIAYTISANTKVIQGKTKFVGRRNAKFLQHLEQLGFVIRDRSVVKEKHADKPFGTDWDVGIALEAMKKINEFDTYILVSGDGDYNVLLEELRNQGKRIEVISFRSCTSLLLHKPAHKITYITEEQVFFSKRSPNGEDQTDAS